MATQDPMVKEVEDRFKSLGLNVATTFDAQFPLVKLKAAKRFQVRDPSHNAPAAAVRQYAEQMKHKKFPPVLITADGYVVDGNTRIAARLKLKEHHTPVVVAEIAYATADLKSRRLLEAYAGIANQEGGQRLTGVEATRLAKNLKIDLGWKNEKIAEHLGISKTLVQNAVCEANTQTRAKSLGLGIKTLNAGQRQALGRDYALSLNDEPFKAIVTLTTDAGLTGKEVQATIRGAEKCGSDADTLEFIATKRAEKKHEIVQRKLTGNGTPPPSVKILPHIGAINKYHGHESHLIEVNPALTSSFLEQVTRARDILNAVLLAQGLQDIVAA